MRHQHFIEIPREGGWFIGWRVQELVSSDGELDWFAGGIYRVRVPSYRLGSLGWLQSDPGWLAQEVELNAVSPSGRVIASVRGRVRPGLYVANEAAAGPDVYRSGARRAWLSWADSYGWSASHLITVPPGGDLESAFAYYDDHLAEVWGFEWVAPPAMGSAAIQRRSDRLMDELVEIKGFTEDELALIREAPVVRADCGALHLRSRFWKFYGEQD